jgi:hypothetical protein
MLDKDVMLRFEESAILTSDYMEDNEDINELKEITESDIHFLFNILRDKKLPLPEAGYEFVNQLDTVIGEVELGWHDRKIAVITSEQKKLLTNAIPDDLHLFEYDDIITNHDDLIDFLEKG